MAYIRNKELEENISFRLSSYINEAEIFNKDLNISIFLEFWTDSLQNIFNLDSRTIINAYEAKSLIYRDEIKNEILRIKITEGW